MRITLLICFVIGLMTSIPGQAQDTLSLDFWTVGTGIDDIEMYQTLAKDFEKETGAKVNITPLSWGNFNQKYLTSMSAGLPPDIGIANLGAPMEWGSMGGLVDFETEFSEDFEDFKSHFFEGMLPQLQFKHHLFGLPTELVSILMFYRKDLFEELNLKVPSTWQELDQVIRSLEANEIHFHFGWTRGEQWAINFHTLPFDLPGAQYVGESRKVQIDWLHPRYQEGVFHALKLWHLHDNQGESTPEKVIGQFLSNRRSEAIGLLIDGSWMGSTIQQLYPQAQDRWGVAPWPKADEGRPHNVMGGTSYVIFRKSKKKELAYQWIKFLNRVESQNFMIMHRLNRKGQASLLNISPIKAVWEPSNDHFWAQSAFDHVRPTLDAVRQIINTFQTKEVVKGKIEADYIEAKILDRMGTFMTDTLTAYAKRHQMSRWEYIQAIASNQFPHEEQQMSQLFSERLSDEYQANYPIALEKIQYEVNNYEKNYGHTIENLEGIDHQSSVLDFLKWFTFALIVIGFSTIFVVKSLRRYWVSFTFVSPPIILAMVFVLIPMMTAFYLSLTEYHSIMPLSAARWVGLKHYLDAFNLGDGNNVVLSFIRTLLYVGITVPFGVILALIFAALLNHKLIGQRFWRFLYFSPLITSAVSVSLIFAQIYNESGYGWLNAFLMKFGLVDNPILFLKDEKTFLYCVMGLAIWHGLAFTILLFLAGLQQIPKHLYQAAEIDGAGWFRKFWHVSLPGIRPQLVFVLLMGVIGGFQVFEQIYMLGGGSGFAGSKFGPNDAGKTMVPLIYDLGFEQFKMGKSSAVAYILFAAIFLLTVLQLKILKRKDAF